MRNEQKIIGAVRYGKDTQFYNDIGQIFKLVLSICIYTYHTFLQYTIVKFPEKQTFLIVEELKIRLYK